MSGLLPELAVSVPPDVQLDGELGAWDRDGHPDFHRLGGAGIEPGPAPRSGYALAGKSWSLPVHADAVDGPPT
jgi:hypothetical protein